MAEESGDFKQQKTKEDEDSLSIKPSELEKDIDNIDFDITSFKRDITVLDNAQIKIILKKVSLKRQKKFKLSDHLFEVVFVPKVSGKAPFLLDLLDFFRMVIVKIILMLKRYYNRGLSSTNKKNVMKVHRQLYGTVVSDHLVRGINTANFSIQTQPEIIAF